MNVSERPVVGIVTNYKYSELELQRFFPSSRLDQPDYEVRLNTAGVFDLLLVLGFPRRPIFVSVPAGRVLKFVQDPIQSGLFGAYTSSSPRYADLVFSPFEDTPYRGHRVSNPTFEWGLSQSFDELARTEQAHQKSGISLIASAKRDLAGHRLRDDFVAEVQRMKLPIDIYGRGRPKQLVFGKDSGLHPYLFSVAIENSIHDNYFTEKLTDCFLARVVPIYSGAPNVRSFFPEESLITFDIAKPREFGEIVSELLANPESNYNKRAHALEEARGIVFDKFSFDGLIRHLIRSLPNSTLPATRRLLFEISTATHAVRDFAATIVGKK